MSSKKVLPTEFVLVNFNSTRGLPGGIECNKPYKGVSQRISKEIKQFWREREKWE